VEKRFIKRAFKNMKFFIFPLGILLMMNPSFAFPDKILLRSNTSTFNNLYNFVIIEGKAWISHRGEDGSSVGPWKILPFHKKLKEAKEISVDSTHVIIVDTDGKIFSSMEGLKKINKIKGTDRWGFPLWLGPGFNLPKKYRSWGISTFNPKEDKYWVDPAGNKQSIGGGITSIYVLSEGGQTLSLTDPWLPLDYSYKVCLPAHGRFITEKMSVSGSTTFVINRYGDMYFKTYDFDISGASTLFFNYTYDPTKGRGTAWDPGILDGAFSIRVIPIDGWTKIPKISGEITEEITIIKTGIGAVNRILRVEGVKDGLSGYFTRETKGDGPWTFVPTGLPLKGNLLENTPEDSTMRALGEDRSLKFYGEIDGLQISITQFDPYCSPAKLNITFPTGEMLTLNMHHNQLLRLTPRKPGLLEKDLKMSGSIEVSQKLLEGINMKSPAVQNFIRKKLGNNRFSKILLWANIEKLKIKKAFGFYWKLDITGE